MMNIKLLKPHIDFNDILINHKRDIGPDFLVKDKCDIIIPVKTDKSNYLFNIREWK